MSDILIRAAETPPELNAVRELLREYGAHLKGSLGAENICLQQYEQALAALPARYEVLLLAAAEEEFAGCVLLKAIENIRGCMPEERACELKRLWVRPPFRGRGVGRLLTESAIGEAKRRGYTALYLDTVPAAMQTAHRIYQELGFVSCERYNDNPVSHVTFFRRLL